MAERAEQCDPEADERRTERLQMVMNQDPEGDSRWLAPIAVFTFTGVISGFLLSGNISTWAAAIGGLTMGSVLGWWIKGQLQKVDRQISHHCKADEMARRQ